MLTQDLQQIGVIFSITNSKLDKIFWKNSLPTKITENVCNTSLYYNLEIIYLSDLFITFNEFSNP